MSELDDGELDPFSVVVNKLQAENDVMREGLARLGVNAYSKTRAEEVATQALNLAKAWKKAAEMAWAAFDFGHSPDEWEDALDALEAARKLEQEGGV